MAWTTPRTYVTGEVITATILNTDIRDNLGYLKAHLDDVERYGTAFPTTGLYTGMRFSLVITGGIAGAVVWRFIRRDDLDGTYPWHLEGGLPLFVQEDTAYTISTLTNNGGWYTNGTVSISVPFSGVYSIEIDAEFDNGAGASVLYYLAGGRTAPTVGIPYGVTTQSLNIASGLIGGRTARGGATLASGETFRTAVSATNTATVVRNRRLSLIPWKVAP